MPVLCGSSFRTFGFRRQRFIFHAKDITSCCSFRLYPGLSSLEVFTSSAFSVQGEGKFLPPLWAKREAERDNRLSALKLWFRAAVAELQGARERKS